MDSDLSAEIARIEAELAQDAEMRQQQLLQQPAAPLMGFGQAPPVQSQQQPFQAQPQQSFQSQTQQPQQQQQLNPFNINVSPFMPTPPQPDYSQQQQQQHQQQQFHSQLQQQSMGSAGQVAAQASAPTSTAHTFSKDTDSRSIFIGNLPRGTDGSATTTPEELVQFFSDCGSILNCTVLKDRATGELKGTAYIEFADYTAMGKAIDTKNNANFKGSTIIVCVTHKRSNFKPGRGGRGAGRGRGRGGAEPLQALAAFMTMLGATSGYRGRGGRGNGARTGGGARGGSTRGANPSGGFQPYQ